MAIAVALLMAAWWQLARGHANVEPIAYLETSLILVIAAEAYAKDE